MEVSVKQAKSILSPQGGGLLVTGPYPFTHSLSAYTGCGFGATTCGLYCYAPFLPNWHYSGLSAEWGQAVQVKENAPILLGKELAKMTSPKRNHLRILMSSTTDPYQPLEKVQQLSRHCLEVFTGYSDLDLLVVQTRSPLATRDLDLMAQLPYLWLSVTVETDDQAYLKKLKGGPALTRRLELVKDAAGLGINTQVVVSPCLPYSNLENFAQQLLATGCKRIVVDTVMEGDGARGQRTARSPFAKAEPNWAETSHAKALYHYLLKQNSGRQIEWGPAGFCGIAPRPRPNSNSNSLFDQLFFETNPEETRVVSPGLSE
jgi:DNA repair photolyase